MASSNTANPDQSDRRYIAKSMDAPMLEREYEMDLARRWRDEGNSDAMHEMINSHIRLVVRIAAGFRGYGLPFNDLIQEGTVGMMEAAKRFDPEREVRFSTYASWWITAAIQEYIVRNASIVRIGTTPAQKSLFFNLRRLRAQLDNPLAATMTEEERRTIARQLGVPIAAVERMEAHLSHADRSLNAAIGGEDTDDFQNFLPDSGPLPDETVIERRSRAARNKRLNSAMEKLTPRERQIISSRFLGDERVTLAEIGQVFGVTKERIRQIESKALAKLRIELGEQIDNVGDYLTA